LQESGTRSASAGKTPAADQEEPMLLGILSLIVVDLFWWLRR
jgi:hypothetical protein